MNMVTPRPITLLVATVAIVVFGVNSAGALDALEQPVSGYEFFPGVPCSLGDSEPASCGVTFGGWTGGDGAVADGWTPFPGTRRGFWSATIDRKGEADFGSSVSIEGGTWKLLLREGFTFFKLSGVVLDGSVEWPEQTDDLGCGTGVASVTAELLVSQLGGVQASFNGCLHDLPAGAIIPPLVWGEFVIN